MLFLFFMYELHVVWVTYMDFTTLSSFTISLTS
jgi:hypothetical protein